MLLAALAIAAPPSVTEGPHNLAVTGRDAKPIAGQQVCITCHTPRAEISVKPLWDPDAHVSSAKAFSAKCWAANPGQPTGASKLCLSCHDGTIAAGNIVSRNQPIQTAEHLTTFVHGKAKPGTDLSDDHPISFLFDGKLASKNTWLRDPHALGEKVSLDSKSEVQCTSCHDPHDNANGKFLVVANSGSELCMSCHQVGPTTVPHHQNCLACHQNHTSPSGDKLLRKNTITNTCLTCHGGGLVAPQGPNVGDDLRKLAYHDTNPQIDVVNHAPSDTACTDCHDPHTMKTHTSTAPTIRGNFGLVAGINAHGKPVNPAKYEYEVCFRCHGDKQDLEPRITRDIKQTNLRLKFSTSAVSFHPVEGRGVNLAVPSLKPPLTMAATIYCTECHSSDTGKKTAKSGAAGPHGSSNAGLLIDRYDTTDYTSESSQSYALCYRCHERNSILSDRSFKLHNVHIVRSRTTCSTCHDPHGISSTQGTAQRHSNLINFDVRIVQKSSNGKLEFVDKGLRIGTCTLKCHGVDHNNFPY
jgi:predicted CXXCH cytochrome family protein